MADHTPAPERFRRRVRKTRTHWWWLGARTSKGYGQLRWRCRRYGAHRFSFELHIGAIPPGVMVLHRCDRPACVNPAHLFLGSHVDNALDMIAKGRGPKQDGALGPAAKLTSTEVRRIKRSLARGVVQRVLAERYRVAPATIGHIATGRTWTRTSTKEE